MERAAGNGAAGGAAVHPAVHTGDPGFALEALRWSWGDYYEITYDEVMGVWLARRLDGQGILEEAATPDELLRLLLEDWQLRPCEIRR